MTSVFTKELGGGERGPQLKDCLSARVLNVQEAKKHGTPGSN